MGKPADVTRPGRASPAFIAYLVLLGVTTLAVLPHALPQALADPAQSFLWVAFLSAGNLLAIPLLPRLNVVATLGTPITVASAVILPAPLAVLVSLLAVSNERELRRETALSLTLFNRLQEGLAAGAASFMAHWLVSPTSDGVLLPLAYMTLMAVVVFTLVNIAAVTAGLWTTRRLSLTAAARDTSAPYRGFAIEYALVTLLALLIVVAHEVVGVMAVALLALPMWLGYSALRSARESEERAQELDVRVRELETLHALGSELLSARETDQVARICQAALRNALASPTVQVSLDGDVDPDLRLIKVAGAEPAAIGVPRDVDDAALAVAEAVAGLVSMALQRLYLEDELAENEKARSRLSGRILEEGTHERSRIAVAIHDEVLPYFAAAQMQADNVRTALSRDDSPRAQELTSRTESAIHAGIGQLREVLDALRLQTIVPGSLRPALQSLLRRLTLEHGVDGHLDAPETLPALPLAVEILAVETVRGCLTNISRHADAGKVRISVGVHDSVLYMEVDDDGRGFDPATVGIGHHGLALMQQRVELARGGFTVRSAPGHGTTVSVEVPV